MQQPASQLQVKTPPQAEYPKGYIEHKHSSRRHISRWQFFAQGCPLTTMIINLYNRENLTINAVLNLHCYYTMRTIVAVIAILMVSAHAQSYEGVFAFSWLAGHCAYQAQTHKELCDPTLISLWDNQSFTVHGIWPTQKATEQYGSFNLKYLEKNLRLLDDMQNYWPAKSKPSSSKTFLWEHEWSTHGHDYAQIIYTLRPSQFTGTVAQRNQKLQLAFFTEAVNFYKRFNVKKIPSGAYTKAEFAKLLGLAQNQFIFSCVKSNIVREVQICYQTTKTGNVIKNCTKTSASCTKGGETIVLENFAFKKQERVFDYPKSLTISAQA